ncbi:hypothetical protein HDV63DRAFT_106841 [Trichoderma sp. SZMC 28014]
MRLINTETFELKVFSDDEVPSYAILSHTWGSDAQELTFLDVQKGISKIPNGPENLGLTKFRNCCEQAKADNFGYAWIDTCCINKADLVELGEAINSMFRWYSLAKVCYAYLSDVPAGDDPSIPGSKFRTSRWFTRGWTLQELLAPKYLRFYNAEWDLIGTKGSRCTVIQEITHVPRQILLGVAELRTASVAQRMSWAAQRNTKRAEDLAYCLLGVFGITMPMIYGEGGKEAFFRLQEQIMKTSRDDSILAWGLDDEPSVRSPQKSIDGDMSVEGDILAATPSQFANSGQVVAREQATNPLHSLDIFGGSLRVHLPIFLHGNGETFGLLSCGPKYDKEQVVAIPLARINSAVEDEYVRPKGLPSVLHSARASHASPKLIHIKRDGQKHISTQNQEVLFYDVDLFAKLGLEVTDVVPRGNWDNQLPVISQTSTDQILIRARQNNEQSLDFVIMIEVRQLDSPTDQLCCVFTCHRDTALDEMAGKFPREALEVFQQTSASTASLNLRVKLEPMEGNIISITPEAMARPPWYTINATMALKNLATMLEPTRLLRERKKIKADLRQLDQRVDECKTHLGDIEKKREMVEEEIQRLEATKSVLAEEEQIKLKEVRSLEEKREDIRKRQNEKSRQVVDTQKRLKAFYHTKKDSWTPFHSSGEIGEIYILDMLFDVATHSMIEDGRWAHTLMASIRGDVDMIRSLLATDETECERRDGIFGRTPLSWASMNGHLDVVKQLLDTNMVDFRSKDIYGKTPLRWALDGGHHEIVRLMLQRDEPAYLRKFCGHSDSVSSVAFSHDSKLILSGSYDQTVRLWDRTTGECLHTFLGHTDTVASVAFSHDSKLVLSGSSDNTIKIWDSAAGARLHTLQGHSDPVRSVAFSHDSTILASGSRDDTIKLWDSITGECLYTLRGHKDDVYSVAFSHDSKLLASGSSDRTIRLWDSSTGECLHTFESHIDLTMSIAFSHASVLLVSGSYENTIKLLDSTTGKCLHTLQGHSGPVCSVAFSHDSKLVLSASHDSTIKFWDSTTGECIYTLDMEKSSDYKFVLSAVFSHDSKSIIAAVENDILLWDTSIVHELVTSSSYQDWSKRKQLNRINEEGN